MKTIADAMSDDDKREYIRDHFKPGSVFYLLSRLPGRTKDKYLLLASPLDPPLFLVINTDVPSFIQNRLHLSLCQVLLKAEDHRQIIEHDCYLDCTATFSISFEEVTKQAMTRMQRLKGRLSQATLQEVVIALERDHRIQLRQKLRMLEALKASLKS
jgi:hypothetical protein